MFYAPLETGFYSFSRKGHPGKMNLGLYGFRVLDLFEKKLIKQIACDIYAA